MKFLFPTVESERQFEKTHVLKLKDYYLNADVMEKAREDEGYRDKLELIDSFLAHEPGWILDIGSHTCGEAEYLSTKGYSIICTEINEYALDISKTRAIKYGRDLLKYTACDGHHMPFQDNSVQVVMFNESLHHMVDAEQSLAEAYRVLAPGGRVFLYEPYAYNPYRRISEVRDYFKGTIEKSFGVGQLKQILNKVGFEVTVVKRHVDIPSTKKLERLPAYRRFLRTFYYQVSQRMPGVFGMVAMLATKPGEPPAGEKKAFQDVLRCPITHTPMCETPEGWFNTDPDHCYRYEALNGIPILIEADAQLVAHAGAGSHI